MEKYNNRPSQKRAVLEPFTFNIALPNIGSSGLEELWAYKVWGSYSENTVTFIFAFKSL